MDYVKATKRLTHDGSGILVPEVAQPDRYNGI